MNIRITRILPTVLFLGALVVLLIGAATPLFAQNGVAVSIQPSQVDERLDPGMVAEGTLTVTNQNGGRQTYLIGARNITGMSDEGRPQFSDVPTDDPWAAAAWIEPLVDEVSLDVGQSGEISYRIMVPADASPGSYFAAIFITRQADVATETGAGVGFNVAALFNIRVSGSATESMQLREFSTDRLFYGSAGTTFTTRVENTGNVHQRPLGIITITDMLGNETAQLTVNDAAGGVMPRTERVFKNDWQPDGLIFGRYTALVSMVFGENQKQTITRETSFWVVPLREVGYVLGGVALAILLFVLALQAYVRRALARAGVAARTPAQDRALSLSQKLIRTFGFIMLLVGLLFIGVIVLNA